MKLIVGVGVPGCGKTTYLKPLAKRLGLAYINADDIRQELTGDPTNHTQEANVWRLANQSLIEALRADGAVMDATYTKIRNRRELIELAREHGAKQIIAYWFNLPMDTCLERNSSRQRKVPDEAINKMHNRLLANPPTLSEGFDEIMEIKE